MVIWELKADRGGHSPIRARNRGGGRQTNPPSTKEKNPPPPHDPKPLDHRGSSIARKLARHTSHAWTTLPIPHEAIDVRAQSLPHHVCLDASLSSSQTPPRHGCLPQEAARATSGFPNILGSSVDPPSVDHSPLLEHIHTCIHEELSQETLLSDDYPNPPPSPLVADLEARALCAKSTATQGALPSDRLSFFILNV
jgi:hypothetical protein